jgi:hypothetical protein
VRAVTKPVARAFFELEGGVNLAESAGKKFYDEQIAYLLAKDVDGLIDNHYTEDAEIIGFEFNYQGALPPLPRNARRD